MANTLEFSSSTVTFGAEVEPFVAWINTVIIGGFVGSPGTKLIDASGISAQLADISCNGWGAVEPVGGGAVADFGMVVGPTGQLYPDNCSNILPVACSARE